MITVLSSSLLTTNNLLTVLCTNNEFKVCVDGAYLLAVLPCDILGCPWANG